MHDKNTLIDTYLHPSAVINTQNPEESCSNKACYNKDQCQLPPWPTILTKLLFVSFSSLNRSLISTFHDIQGNSENYFWKIT